MGCRRGWEGRLIALGLLGLVGACVIKTDLIAQQFNSGAIDTPSDPARLPSERKEAIVVQLLREELMDAYFQQGKACGAVWGEPAGTNVCAGLDRASRYPDPKESDPFVEYVKCFAYETEREDCDVLQSGGPAQPADDASSVMQQAPRPELGAELKRGASRVTDRWLSPYPRAPLCRGAELEPNVVGPFVDRIRFDLAVARAAEAVGNVLREGLVNEEAVITGKQRGFHDAALYLRNRRWQRQTAQRTLGLAAKGGSATGIYTSGAVWTILNLIRGCTKEPEACGLPRGAKIEFQVLSGTSTGTMVVTGVDRFFSYNTDPERQAAIDDLARWFTCLSLNDLYCVESADLFSLASDGHRGVLKFDGIRNVLSRCVRDEQLTNGTELVLNITDFRSGRLLHLSDQGELTGKCDVVSAAVASAALPFFVFPEPDMRVDVDAPEKREGAYVDGGIRSEIPLLAMVKRGVERAIVVSSSASVLADTEKLKSGVDVGLRYIDVATGGVSEMELDHAQRRAESVRYSEYDACRLALENHPEMCLPPCDPEALCEGRWEDACKLAAPEAAAPDPEGKVVEDERPKRQASPEERIRPLWDVERIFRNTEEIEGLHGYDFNPDDMRRLFRGGAESTRQRCVQIAGKLGIPAPGVPLTPAIVATLMRFCNTRLAPPEQLCQGFRPSSDDEIIPLRSCDERAPVNDFTVCTGAPAEAQCQEPE